MTARHSRGPRLFLSDVRFVFSPDTPQQIILPSEQSHYVRDVLRLGVGDPIEIGSTHERAVASGSITTVGEFVTITLHAHIEAQSTLREIHLLCALCKGEKNEQILDWATELGCSSVHFWQASRSIVRLKNEQDISRKLVRFSKIALAAAQQSRQTSPLSVAIHQTLAAAVNCIPGSKSHAKTICSLSPGAASIHTFLRTLSASTPLVVGIGPEGDLTPEEEELLCKDYGFTRVSLGPSVLRSELAAITAIISIRAHDTCAITP